MQQGKGRSHRCTRSRQGSRLQSAPARSRSVYRPGSGAKRHAICGEVAVVCPAVAGRENLTVHDTLLSGWSVAGTPLTGRPKYRSAFPVICPEMTGQRTWGFPTIRRFCFFEAPRQHDPSPPSETCGHDSRSGTGSRGWQRSRDSPTTRPAAFTGFSDSASRTNCGTGWFASQQVAVIRPAPCPVQRLVLTIARQPSRARTNWF